MRHDIGSLRDPLPVCWIVPIEIKIRNLPRRGRLANLPGAAQKQHLAVFAQMMRGNAVVEPWERRNHWTKIERDRFQSRPKSSKLDFGSLKDCLQTR